VIAFVRGRVAEVGVDAAVVDVGGVGLSVLCTPTTLAGLRTGDSAQLATSLVVREDSLTLFGFADTDERTVFETVQTVSGIGPRLAQALLATMGPDDLRRAVATEDLVALTRVPGVGRKGAQRLVLELKDRLGPPVSAAASADDDLAASTGAAPEAWRTAVHAGLVSLGWAAREADAAVDEVAPLAHEQAEAGTGPDVAVLLKAALRSLDRA
jgi:holliday junction DNA helicase RuvA